MTLSRIERAFAVLLVAGSMAMAAADGSAAGTRKASTARTVARAQAQTVAQPQKPVKMRYFGGPKNMMYSE